MARTPHPTLLLTYAAAAKDLRHTDVAVATLRQLYDITGDPKFAQMADELSSP